MLQTQRPAHCVGQVARRLSNRCGTGKLTDAKKLHIETETVKSRLQSSLQARIQARIQFRRIWAGLGQSNIIRHSPIRDSVA